MAGAMIPPGKVLARGGPSSATEFDLFGWPENGPRLRLDYRRLAYAGKFAIAAMGKAVPRDPDNSLPPLDDDRPTSAGGPDSLPPLTEDVVAAVAFDENRMDPTTLWLRYVTVRRDRWGDGPDPNFLRRTCDAADRGYKAVCIATNNSLAYKACHKAGFGLTGRGTGIAELVLGHPAGASAAVSREAYQSGSDRHRVHDLDDPERVFLAAYKRVESPETDAGHSDD